MSYFHIDTGAKDNEETGKGRHASYQEISKRVSLVELEKPLCYTCSTQTSYAGTGIDFASEDAEHKCTVCLDPRQYIGILGQRWTTLIRLIDAKTYFNEIKELIHGRLWTIRTEPAFGIGQRAFLIKEPGVEGLVMWDCIAFLDDATLAEIESISKGKGIKHMIISHPHYFSTTSIWAAAYPNMTMWLSKVDFAEWYQRQDVVMALSQGLENTFAGQVASQIRLVEQEQTRIEANVQITILLLGGHFPGSLVLLWDDILLIADTIQVVPSGRYKSHEPQRDDVASVTFLWSYPNQIPLSAAEVNRVCEPLTKVTFDKAFGAFEGFDIWGYAQDKILQSRDIFTKRLSAP